MSFSSDEGCIFPKLEGCKDPKSQEAGTIPFQPRLVSSWSNFCQQKSLDSVAATCVAWGILLRCFVASPEVLFGHVVIGHGVNAEDVEFDGRKRWYFMLKETSLLEDLLMDSQSDTLCRRGKNTNEYQSREPCNEREFNTLLVEVRDAKSINEMQDRDLAILRYPQAKIILTVAHQESDMALSLSYTTEILSHQQASHVTHALQQILTEIMQKPDATVGDLDLLGDYGTRRVWNWNSELPPAQPMCVYPVIAQRCVDQTERVAVAAWDGSLTYGELFHLSSELSLQLADLRVGSKTFVPLCFNKSKWAVVAVLAVIMTGAAYTFLDPSHPAARLQSICEDLQAKVILTSPDHASNIKLSLTKQIVSIGDEIFHRNNNKDTRFMTIKLQKQIQPTTPLYAVFTSGSTGKPKGLVMENAGFCAAASTNVPAIGLDRDSRVLQFANYTYDVANRDILFTLMHGGCLCIPSESTRLNNLTGFMNEFGVNWASLTPSIAELLQPDRLRNLKHLVIGGEAMTDAVVAKWAGRVHLMNAYGPAECAAISCLRTDIQPDSDPSNIGYGLGCSLWILNTMDCDKLAPIGATGELVIESDTVSRGYLNDDGNASLSFLNSLPIISASRAFPRRLYKTGDLVRYNSDGSLVFLGRKDTQVKIRGQRIELRDVESHVRKCMEDLSPKPMDVVVDAISSRSGEAPKLVAFLSYGAVISHELNGSIMKPPDAGTRARLDTWLSTLSSHLPSHMIPSSVVPVKGFPLTSSGKVYRKLLRETFLHSRAETNDGLANATASREPPKSDVEVCLQHLWSQILGRVPGLIGRADHFVRCGGDSITAMNLVDMANSSGLSLTVSDVLLHPQLADMASVAKVARRKDLQAEATFTLFPDEETKDSALTAAITQCDITQKQIEDMYPTTAMQDGLIALTAKTPGAYIERFVYDLPRDVDVDRFQRAWEATLRANPVLRTRIVATTSRMYQVVLTEGTSCELKENVNGSALQSHDAQMLLGQSLVEPTLVRIHDVDLPRLYFCLNIHHALYDGWSIPRLLRQLECAYNGETLRVRTFSPFIKYMLDSLPAAEAFWETRLSGVKALPFPHLPHSTYIPTPSLVAERTITIDDGLMSGDFTPSVKLRLAWAIVISRYTDAEEAAFGVITTGRGTPVPGVTEMTGPTLATVPLWLKFQPNATVEETLQQVQRDASITIPFEQLGLQKIRQLGGDAAEACQFQSVLLVDMEDTQSGLGLLKKSALFKANPLAASTYAINLVCRLSAKRAQLLASFDVNVISEQQMQRMLNQFVHVVRQLSGQPGLPIKEVTLLCPEDNAQIQKWNGRFPEPARLCIHAVIQQQSLEQPRATVVCAWDGSLTYADLDHLSSCLAVQLMEQGIGPELFVPICFEKSKWTTVAILAVLKAGAAFVLLDPSVPHKRLQGICNSIDAHVIVSSTQNAALASELVTNVIALGDKATEWLTSSGTSAKPGPVSPDNAAYVIFTSGSTGTPKGVVITHAAFVASAMAHGSALGLSSATRIYQFASYTFDICIGEHLSVMVHGGCICVPSSADARASLAPSFKALRANTIALTPSVARSLSPSGLDGLTTMILGGEAPQEAEIQLWSAHARVMITYGPAECAVASSVQADVGPMDDFRLLGVPKGCAYWIVDPENHDRLTPIGLVGEILIEGPILGRGYLNDPERSNASFIENPAWATHFRAAHHHPVRLYKTGDLAQYTGDGLFQFSGRKDNQVKIRGQRVELAEVEHHVLHSFVGASDVVVEVVTPLEFSHPMLVAFVYCGDENSGTCDTQELFAPSSDRFRNKVRNSKSELAKRVPGYMIPAIFLPLLELPRNHNGKADRRRLRDITSTLPRETLQLYIAKNGPKRAPSTDKERTIQSIWAQVLNIDIEDIGLDDEYANLGGDSITAMQTVAQLQKHGISVTTTDLMTFNTVALLSKRMDISTHEPTPAVEEPLGDWFDLSPMQQFFFDTMTVNLNHLTQKFLLRVGMTKVIDPGALEAAIEALVDRHAMLRAQFSHRNGKWVQRIQKNSKEKGRFRYDNHNVSSIAAVQAITSNSQRSLDIEKGPLFSVDLITLGGTQYLFLVAHFLVIDLFSWRVLWQELEGLLNTGDLPRQRPFSFQSWCRIQGNYARTHLSPEVVLPLKVPSVPRDYWGHIGQNTFASSIQTEFTLDEHLTERLVEAAKNEFKSTPADFLHAKLLHSFVRVFDDRQAPTIFTGGHGRQAWCSDIDLSSTVGWFVTLCPSHVAATSQDSITAILRDINEWRSKTPRNGSDFFASRFLNPRGREAFKDLSPIEIMFNYNGLYQQLERRHALLQAISEGEDKMYGDPPDLQRFALINVSIFIEFNRFRFTFVYNKHISHQDKLAEWVRVYEQSLQQPLR